LKKVDRRLLSEGTGFLTKTLPRLGKAFDKALTGDTPMNSTDIGFKPIPGSKLPMFMGELFREVLHQDGTVLQHPSVNSVRVLRQITYLFYKYELPYTNEQEQRVVSRFEKTENDLSTSDLYLEEISERIAAIRPGSRKVYNPANHARVAREARNLLERVFQAFEPENIAPSHGPGAVATKQLPWEKYEWTNVSKAITSVYLSTHTFARREDTFVICTRSLTPVQTGSIRHGFCSYRRTLEVRVSYPVNPLIINGSNRAWGALSSIMWRD